MMTVLPSSLILLLLLTVAYSQYLEQVEYYDLKDVENLIRDVDETAEKRNGIVHMGQRRSKLKKGRRTKGKHNLIDDSVNNELIGGIPADASMRLNNQLSNPLLSGMVNNNFLMNKATDSQIG